MHASYPNDFESTTGYSWWQMQHHVDDYLSWYVSFTGSGLHTFVLYLGPHIAFFTIKAMQCGRVDIKSAPYDTIQMKHGPSWLGKNCSEFGPSLFSSTHGIHVPLSSILPQVQIEAVLWGLGTALGELPPYFVSRAGINCYYLLVVQALCRVRKFM